MALLLVLIGGSPMYSRWVTSSTDENSAAGWWLRLVAWPAWSFDANQSVQNVIAADLKAILLVLFTWGFLVLLPGSQLASARGGLSQFLAGWAAYIFAATFAALIAAAILTNPSVLAAFQQAAGGAVYGVFVGWIVGAAALGARRGTRS
ncbi:MAG TPA: hypothetical protein VFC19_28775 [Candidatus Limnocylindrales bacterium]|nr:hypothetical protein [Candidatus Limnocylindrales bacterium]